VVRPYRKPLILFTPKSLLRHPETVSSMKDLAQGGFKTVLDDPRELDPNAVQRLVFCSGRIYYDLIKACRERELNHIALIRIEQLYPVPDEEIREIILRYPRVQGITWAQDEPQNQGAWRFIAYQIRMQSGIWLDYAGRPESASPATGIAELHKQQLDAILAAALD
jgi:2-oxoglutarate dehydrogenase E1 component